MVAVQTVGRAVLVASLTAVCGCQTATEQRLQALLAECNSGNQASCAAVPMYQHQEALEAGERRTRAEMMLGAAAVIQAASQRALKSGATLAKILQMIATLRRTMAVPIVLFGYYNPILSYGPERFAADAAASSVDGILVVDLPPEESEELRQYTDAAGLAFITLVAPTTDPARARKILRNASGFVYYISVTGVTGTAAPRAEDVRGDVQRIKGLTTLPVAVGFGISTPAQASAMAPLADGFVVGSALVRLIGENTPTAAIIPAVSSFAGEIRRAIDAAMESLSGGE